MTAAAAAQPKIFAASAFSHVRQGKLFLCFAAVTVQLLPAHHLMLARHCCSFAML
jgi:hypothetical protein